MISAPVVLTSGDASPFANSQATASVTPTAGALVFTAFVMDDSTLTGDPTVTGCGLTWAKAGEAVTGDRLAYVYRAQGTPTTGAITIAAPTGEVIEDIAWIVAEIVDATVGNNGADALIQVAENYTASDSSVPHVVPFTDPMQAGSASVAFVAAIGGAYNATAQAGWTDLERAAVGGVLAIELHYLLGTSTQVETQWNSGTTSIGQIAIGFEVTDAGGGDPTTPITGTASGTSSDSATAVLTLSATATDTGTSSDSATATLAQSIMGTVTASGSPVQGATIYLIDQATDSVIATETTAVDGTYTFAGVSPGTYHVVAEAEGYAAPSRSFVVIE